ncbi:GDP-mannose 4,6-dehydratase [candidate division KSB1 bacterium]|nr:GDP-mannose 4,6-dehydratase [candidate division KSB1 bacterium]
MMKLLVTGGAGFIGSHLVEKLLFEGHKIVCLDNFNDYYDPSIKRKNIQNVSGKKEYELIEGDILDISLLQKIFSQHQFDVVVHLAARAGVRPSISEPLLYEKVNVQGTMHLLEQCREHGVDKFVFASSSSVYGANKKVPFSENDSVDNPVSPYAATKKSGELICFTYHKLYNISVNCLRFFTVYGPRQRPDMAIHKFARLIDNSSPIPVFGSGKSRRDYTFIDDILQGIRGAIEFCNGYHIYNLGESKTIELHYLIDLLQQKLGRKAVINYLPDQPGDVPITFADISLAKKELKYNPRVGIEEGIDKFVDWFKHIKQ